VRGVAPDGPSAGQIQPGDIILEADRKPVASASDLKSKVREAPASKPILLRVKRGESTRYVAIERH
jgi:S1-C subfamily serine protease